MGRTLVSRFAGPSLPADLRGGRKVACRVAARADGLFSREPVLVRSSQVCPAGPRSSGVCRSRRSTFGLLRSLCQAGAAAGFGELRAFPAKRATQPSFGYGTSEESRVG